MPKSRGAEIVKSCQFCDCQFNVLLIEERRQPVKYCSAKCYHSYQKSIKLSREELANRDLERRRKLKLIVLAYYSCGIPQCKRCGNTDTDVLCLDHIEGGGTKTRITTGQWGTKLHHYLKRNNYPEGYQVLCANCNLKKFVVEGK